jgi:hypothetical protein
MTWGDDVAQSPSLTEPKWGWSVPPPRLAGQVLAPLQFWLCKHVKEGRCTGYPMAKVGGGWVGWPAGHMYAWPARVRWVTTSNQWWSSLIAPIKTPHTPFGVMEIRKWGLPSYSAPMFILCRVERERRGSKSRRTSWLVGSPLSNSSTEALPESIRVRRSFPSSSSVECGSSAEILWILTENRLSSPVGALES